MKNTIRYYYNFDNITIISQKNKKYIKYNNELYIACKVKNENEVIELYNLTKNIPYFYKFIINREGKIFTNYKNDTFVLLKITGNYSSNIQKNKKIIIDNNKKYHLDRSDWYSLWTQKNDYFEYQYNHIKGKYKIIDESINYYIGIAENAISYIANISGELKGKEEKVLCHRRIEENEFFNPLNYVIDYKERELSEYLKYIFVTKKYTECDVEKLVTSCNSTQAGYQLLFGRMLYPSIYFDIYDKIINEYESESSLMCIIKRNREYENYLQRIFEAINANVKIKNIDWL